MTTSRLERFEAKHDKGPSCWLWTASTCSGYGNFWDGERKISAHRWSYEHYVGPIPEGLQIDHLCGTPLCVNPGHLEPVTHRVNNLRGITNATAVNARKTHCKHGHEFTEANTLTRRDRNKAPSRRCRTCHRGQSGRA